MLDIVADNAISACSNCDCENMAILGLIPHRVNEHFISGHQRFRKGFMHSIDASRSLYFGITEFHDGSFYFVEDVSRPEGTEEWRIMLGEP
jgi:hypothetical protein